MDEGLCGPAFFYRSIGASLRRRRAARLLSSGWAGDERFAGVLWGCGPDEGGESG